jgi:hypothetical protein
MNASLPLKTISISQTLLAETSKRDFEEGHSFFVWLNTVTCRPTIEFAWMVL